MGAVPMWRMPELGFAASTEVFKVNLTECECRESDLRLARLQKHRRRRICSLDRRTDKRKTFQEPEGQRSEYFIPEFCQGCPINSLLPAGRRDKETNATKGVEKSIKKRMAV